MANEVKIATTFSFTSDGLSLNGSNTFNYSISGTNAFGNVQVINSGVSEFLGFQDLADVRYLYLKNQSTGNNVSLSLNSGQSQVFSILRPGESLLMPPNSTGLWASGVGAAIDLQILANET
jgi:hypothetical protein